MTQGTRYNGWSNYETWAVKLWMDNEQSSQEDALGSARETWNGNGIFPTDTPFTRSEAARIALADILKDDYEEGVPESIQGTVYADLLNAALADVDWFEIADSLLSEAELDGYEPKS